MIVTQDNVQPMTGVIGQKIQEARARAWLRQTLPNRCKQIRGKSILIMSRYWDKKSKPPLRGGL